MYTTTSVSAETVADAGLPLRKLISPKVAEAPILAICKLRPLMIFCRYKRQSINRSSEQTKCTFVLHVPRFVRSP